MAAQILKTIAAGILAGVALFMIPFFLIKVLIFFLLIKAIFRLLGGRRRYWGHVHPAYAHKFHNMSDEERKAFMTKYGHRCRHYYRENDSEVKEEPNK